MWQLLCLNVVHLEVVSRKAALTAMEREGEGKGGSERKEGAEIGVWQQRYEEVSDAVSGLKEDKGHSTALGSLACLAAVANSLPAALSE